MLYTLGHACRDAVSWGSENHVDQMARPTELELDVKESQWTYAQFPSGPTMWRNSTMVRTVR